MNRNEYEETRLQLSRYRFMLDRLANRQQEYWEWETHLTSAQSSAVGKVGKNSGAIAGQDFGYMLATKERIAEECEKLHKETLRLRSDIMSAIEELRNFQHKDILEKVYINGKTVAVLAHEAGCSEKTIQRTLKSALKELMQETDVLKKLA